MISSSGGSTDGVLLDFRFTFAVELAGSFEPELCAFSFEVLSSVRVRGVGIRMMGVGPEKSFPVRRDKVEMSKAA
jgi:hypothetical protein